MSKACLVSDPGIPTLEKALDPTVLRECLPEVLPSEWGAIRDVRLEVLKHHAGRRYGAGRAPEGPAEFFGGMLAEPRRPRLAVGRQGEPAVRPPERCRTGAR